MEYHLLHHNSSNNSSNNIISTYSCYTYSWLLQLRTLCQILLTYLVVLPLASYLWTLDEVLYGRPYRNITIRKPLLTISVPRAGTTSFHRTLALDTMLELVMPFICVHQLVMAMQRYCPTIVISRLEDFLKYWNYVTVDVEARHPISLLTPDADDILLGEWHWVSVGAVRLSRNIGTSTTIK